MDIKEAAPDVLQHTEANDEPTDHLDKMNNRPVTINYDGGGGNLEPAPRKYGAPVAVESGPKKRGDSADIDPGPRKCVRGDDLTPRRALRLRAARRHFFMARAVIDNAPAAWETKVISMVRDHAAKEERITSDMVRDLLSPKPPIRVMPYLMREVCRRVPEAMPHISLGLGEANLVFPRVWAEYQKVNGYV